MGHGGARPGAGRKHGSKLPKTLEKEKVLKQLNQRVLKHAHRLFNAQMNVAAGCTFLYKIIRRGKKRVHVKVTDENEIRDYLDGKFEEGQDYYYITTKEPNNLAIESMMNRVFGKPKETVDVSLTKKIILDDNDDDNTGGDNKVQRAG